MNSGVRTVPVDSGVTCRSVGEPVSSSVSGGVLAVSPGRWYKVDTEGRAATDNIDTISGLSEGEYVWLSCVSNSRVPTIRTGYGNITLPVGNIPLNDVNKMCKLFHNGTYLVEASSRP